MPPTVLVVGASGVNGITTTRRLVAAGTDVVTLSRADAPVVDGVRHVSADLLDPDALAGNLAEVSHVVYAALAPDDDPREEADRNGAMLANLLDVLDDEAALEHLLFLQGGKVYGAHLGTYRTPAREDDSRHFPPNLYFTQEDLVRERAGQQGWRWTALRPDIVIGPSVGSPMNLGNLVGVYGALCRELGVAMQFPGTAAAYDVLVNVTDADVVADAVRWAFDGRHEGAFNVTNGDVFRWRHVWPRLAAWFGLPTGEPQPISLATRIDAVRDTWATLAEREGLAHADPDELAAGDFGDVIFHVEDDAIFDVTRARQAGLDAMSRRSDDSLVAHLDGMRERRELP